MTEFFTTSHGHQVKIADIREIGSLHRKFQFRERWQFTITMCPLADDTIYYNTEYTSKFEARVVQEVLRARL